MQLGSDSGERAEYGTGVGRYNSIDYAAGSGIQSTSRRDKAREASTQKRDKKEEVQVEWMKWLGIVLDETQTPAKTRGAGRQGACWELKPDR